MKIKRGVYLYTNKEGEVALVLVEGALKEIIINGADRHIYKKLIYRNSVGRRCIESFNIMYEIFRSHKMKYLGRL